MSRVLPYRRGQMGVRQSPITLPVMVISSLSIGS